MTETSEPFRPRTEVPVENIGRTTLFRTCSCTAKDRLIKIMFAYDEPSTPIQETQSNNKPLDQRIARYMSDREELRRLKLTLPITLARVDQLVVSAKRATTVNTTEPLVEMSSLAHDLEQNIVFLYKFIRDRFRHRFPELGILVFDPFEYIRSVRRIGVEMNVLTINFKDILSPATTTAVKSASLITEGKRLSRSERIIIRVACTIACYMDRAILKASPCICTLTLKVSPLLYTFLGWYLASKLIGDAGGLWELAQIAGSDIIALGSDLASPVGGTRSHEDGPRGYLYFSETSQQFPDAHRQEHQLFVAELTKHIAHLDYLFKVGVSTEKHRKVHRCFRRWLKKLPEGTCRMGALCNSEVHSGRIA